jgi:hypothetical protein
MEASFCRCRSFDDTPKMNPCTIEIRRARIPHVCCECDEQIEPGQQYQSGRGKFDGYWLSYHTCIPCSRIARDYCAPFGHLRAQIRELLGFDYVTGQENGP